MIGDILRDSGFDVVDEGFKALWNPDEAALAAAAEYAKAFAAKAANQRDMPPTKGV